MVAGPDGLGHSRAGLCCSHPLPGWLPLCCSHSPPMPQTPSCHPLLALGLLGTNITSTGSLGLRSSDGGLAQAIPAALSLPKPSLSALRLFYNGSPWRSSHDASALEGQDHTVNPIQTFLSWEGFPYPSFKSYASDNSRQSKRRGANIFHHANITCKEKNMFNKWKPDGPGKVATPFVPGKFFFPLRNTHQLNPEWENKISPLKLCTHKKCCYYLDSQVHQRKITTHRKPDSDASWFHGIRA